MITRALLMTAKRENSVQGRYRTRVQNFSSFILLGDWIMGTMPWHMGIFQRCMNGEGRYLYFGLRRSIFEAVCLWYCILAPGGSNKLFGTLGIFQGYIKGGVGRQIFRVVKEYTVVCLWYCILAPGGSNKLSCRLHRKRTRESDTLHKLFTLHTRGDRLYFSVIEENALLYIAIVFY